MPISIHETKYQAGHHKLQSPNEGKRPSGTMFFVHKVVLFMGILALCQDTSAWMTPAITVTKSSGAPIPIYLESRSLTTLNAEATKEDGEVEIIGIDDNKPAIEWGASYIGGDPCGSKYNSDPFDKKPSDKPGMPDDMKARIAALAQKKLEEERKKDN